MSDHSAEEKGVVGSPQNDIKDKKKNPHNDVSRRGSALGGRARIISVQHETHDIQEGQIFSMNDVDPALDAKMRLVNNAIEEIGFTTMHFKLFCLNGFGYFADTLVLLLQLVTANAAANEFRPYFTKGLTAASYTGQLVGALFWGMSADIIGRRIAFNFSLFICAVFAILATASPNWIVLGLFTALSAFGAGGNLVLDTTVFLEFLPGKYQWLVTTLACWSGLATVVVAGFAWPLLSLPQYYCEIGSACPYDSNKGWRYIWLGCGLLVFVAAILRVTIIRLKETPKYLIGKGKDQEVVETFQYIAQKYNRTCSLTFEQLDSCGVIKSTYGEKRYSVGELWAHIRGLYATKKLGLQTSLLWISWVLIGLAYPLFYVFLPDYLAAKGAQTGEATPYYIWRNYLISNTVGIFGPMAAGLMCNTSYLGRRYTMVIGALAGMAFFFAYASVNTAAQNLAFTCMIYFFVNIYYGTLYAYTPETLPSAHRATGNGIAVAFNRVMGLVSAFVAAYANTATAAPLYLCAALYVVMALIAMIMPFEPYGRKSM